MLSVIKKYAFFQFSSFTPCAYCN